MIDFDVRRYKTLDSTSTFLKALAEEGEREGVVVIADEQTAGRGRRGRSFYSPDSSGLYMSFLLRPSLPPSEALFITTATAVAVSRAIESLYDKKAEIKWVNDILIDGKKAAGILTEASFSGDSSRLDYVIVGVGVNVTTSAFPDEIKDIAISLGEDRKEALAGAILEEFRKIYDSFPEHTFFEEYKSRSAVIGREIEILGEERRFGRALGIDGECRLEVMLDSGEVVRLSSGEVSTRIKTM